MNYIIFLFVYVKMNLYLCLLTHNEGSKNILQILKFYLSRSDDFSFICYAHRILITVEEAMAAMKKAQEVKLELPKG